MEYYECGTTIKLKIGGGYGMITAVTNRFGVVFYEIYTSSGETITKHEKEFEVVNEEKKIGYSKQ